MNKIDRLNESVARLYNVYDKLKKIPRDYGCGFLMNASEIHTIELIKHYPNHNASQLSEIYGVTKGLLSRWVKKLEEQGLIKKYQYTDNRKEIFYKLTDLGETAYKGHVAFHKKNNERLFSKLEHMPADEYMIVLKFLDQYTEGLLGDSE